MASKLPNENMHSRIIVTVTFVVIGLIFIGTTCYGFLFYLPSQGTYQSYIAVGFFAVGAIGLVLALWGLLYATGSSLRQGYVEHGYYKYCPRCRYDLRSEPEPIHCTKCKSPLKSGMLYCGYCSHPTQQPTEATNGDKNTNPSMPVAQKTTLLNDPPIGA
jgi:hypothetical protein